MSKDTSKGPKAPRGLAALVGQRAAESKAAGQTIDAVLRAPSGGATRIVAIDQVRRSPFQPVSRPSSAAIATVRTALAAAGSLAALVGTAADALSEEGSLARLDPDARELALLAADIAANGVDTPLEVRTVAGGVELLSGHRRLAAAQLAGLTEIRVTEVPVTSDAQAAEIVFRRNRLRQDFAAWEEARSLAELQTRRNAARAARGEGAEPLRSLAAAMGYSVGRVSELLRIARTILPVLPDLGAPTLAAAEEALAALPYMWLRDASAIAASETAGTEKARRRDLVATIRLKTRLGSSGTGARSDEPTSRGGAAAPEALTAFSVEPRDPAKTRRLGAPAFALTVRKAPEAFTPAEAAALLDVLERRLLKALRARARAKRA